jgi:hypothetical protein
MGSPARCHAPGILPRLVEVLSAADGAWDEETGDGPVAPQYIEHLAAAVAPELAAKDLAVRLGHAITKQHNEEIERLRAEVQRERRTATDLKAHLVKEQERLRTKLAGVREQRDAYMDTLANIRDGEPMSTAAGIARLTLQQQGYLPYGRLMEAQAEVERLTAEVQRERESRQDWAIEAIRLDDELAKMRLAYEGAKFQRDELRAELEALKANARPCGLNPDCAECGLSCGYQPDTEATEQAPRCGEPGHNREFCDEPVPDGFCSEHGEVGPPVKPCGAVGFWGARNNRYECDKPKGHTEQLHENSSASPPVIWFGDHAEQPAAPATPAEPRDVYHDPGDVQYEYDEDDNPISPSVGWDIAFGCRVTFGHDDDGWRVSVSVSDAERRNGGSIRACDRHQIRAFAYHLIQLTEVVEVVEDQPKAPAEQRVWRKGDPEPPEHIQVLVDCKDDHLPYLCRIPGSPQWWQWFERPADRRRAPGGVPWSEATAVMGSGPKDYVVGLPEMTEAVEDGAAEDTQ